MIHYLKSYFSYHSLSTRWKNSKVSLVCYFDKFSQISKEACINRFAMIRGSSVGNYSYIGPSCFLLNVDIGKFCSISKSVTLGSFLHPTNYVSSSPLFISEFNGTKSSWIKEKKFNENSLRITCGSDVWIGTDALVMGGVNIGHGAIIGAHAVVTKDVPNYAIVGGVPAKIIKYRFSREIIEGLERLEWWNWSDESIKKNLDLFGTELTTEIIEKLENRIVQ